VLREIISARLKTHAEMSWEGVPPFLTQFEHDAARSLITQAVAANIPTENLFQKITGVVSLLRNEFIDRQLAALTQKLAQPNLADSDFMEIEKQKAQLRTQKKRPIEMSKQ
jgi:hypothetical protein